MRFGVIGSGSWATALAKILTDNRNPVNWWIRNEAIIRHIKARHHNPQYLSSVYFDTSLLSLSGSVSDVIAASDCLVMAVPSAYTASTLEGLDKNAFRGKKVLSAIKGILPEQNLLLNEWLAREFKLDPDSYFTVMGPCHAEEVAAEKLSYLTFSGLDAAATRALADFFTTEYLNTIVNPDIYGVQYAAVLKNIYALGAGIAHGLEYGDNFLSVLIANSADEMAGFLRKVGVHPANYAASVYLGDLLVTCYSLYSRNRTFGNMIGKGYSVQAARLELNMVAEGYNASKCIYLINKEIKAEMPIAAMIYRILWENVNVAIGMKQIEPYLV
ncbi:MAG TPA: NAD(P)H-dependent glycerol-3-phosphate dehydrogenase [Puia sp.]|jgi:glycerol-3-phosphate dehydrogenase (NAD(P)+)|nr:NAD(P)H-dependent glycerol-3-phosphate dehydrogenase [Puia sp.]